MKKKQENNLKKISKQSIGVELPIDTDMDGDVDNMDEQQQEIPFNDPISKDLSYSKKRTFKPSS
jgi:hypothetical protein